MRNIASFLKILFVVLVIILVIAYTYYKTKDFIRGPIIIVASPANGIAVNSPLVEIVGKAERIAYISLDDRQIFTDEDGNFKEKLLLSPGYNIISIKASDKFDRNIEKTLEMMYTEPRGIKKIETNTSNKEPPGSAQNATTTKENINELLN